MHRSHLVGSELRKLDRTGVASNEGGKQPGGLCSALFIDDHPSRVLAIFAAPVEVCKVSHRKDSRSFP